MATKKNIKRVATRVLDFVLFAICWIGKAVENVGKGIIIVLFCIMYGIITLLFYNPFVLFFIALVLPNSVARGLKGMEEDSFTSCWGEFINALNIPMIKLLPWYAKKAFLRTHCLNNASIKQQVRFFEGASDKAEIVKNNWLDNEAKQILWENKEYSELLVGTFALSDEQFQILLWDGQISLIKKYIAKDTLSEAKVLALLDNVAKLDDEERSYWKILKFSIQRNGLSSRLVSLVYSDFASLKDEVSNALMIYAQKQVILSTQNYHFNGDKDTWNKFCAITEAIFEEAQACMAIWQYDIFHEYGYQLSEKAIVYFLSKGDITMAERIFNYEPKNGILSNEIEAVIAANPRLMNSLLRIVA